MRKEDYAEKYLKSLKKINKLICNKEIEKAQWRSVAMSMGGSGDGERVQSSGSQQKMSEAVLHIVEIEREIDALIDSYVDKKKEIISVLEELEADEYDVLHKLYIQEVDAGIVAIECNKSYSWVMKKRMTGLQQVAEVLNKRREEKKHGKCKTAKNDGDSASKDIE